MYWLCGGTLSFCNIWKILWMQSGTQTWTSSQRDPHVPLSLNYCQWGVQSPLCKANVRSHCALSCDGGCISHSPCSSLSPPLLSSPGLQVWGERKDVQSLLNGSGDAGAAADQVCNVQRVTLQNEAWKSVKISSRESASSVCGCFLFFTCKFCVRMWKD